MTVCPECGSEKTAEIVYGYPSSDYMPKYLSDAKEGKIIPGGCCVTDNDPKWECTECTHQWGRAEHD